MDSPDPVAETCPPGWIPRILLPSLLPREARADISSSPVRYLQVLNPYGPTAGLFFGNISTNQSPEPFVNLRALSEVQGPISPIFGTEFGSYRSRMSLLHGLDVQLNNANHQYVFPTCACSYAGGIDNDEGAPVSGQPSVDMMMAQSAKVYDEGFPEIQRVVFMNPVTTDDYSRNRTFSWRLNTSGPEIIRPVKQTQPLIDPFAVGFAAGSMDTQDPRETALLDAVYDDYKTVRDGARISATDRQRLESYMALIEDIQVGSVTAACEEPQQTAENDIEQTIDNQFRIIAAAMACGLNRIASIVLGMSAGYGARHDEHHNLHANTNVGLKDDFVQNGKRVARLLAMLDDVIEADGSLLDNAIVYWSMQYGMVQVDGQHNAASMPALVASGAGGRLQQGNYIDYRIEGTNTGIVINNLLVTFMNCMGLSSSDYEKDAGQGYSHYAGDLGNRPNGAFWASTEGRRSALPVIYQGPAMG